MGIINCSRELSPADLSNADSFERVMVTLRCPFHALLLHIDAALGNIPRTSPLPLVVEYSTLLLGSIACECANVVLNMCYDSCNVKHFLEVRFHHSGVFTHLCLDREFCGKR